MGCTLGAENGTAGLSTAGIIVVPALVESGILLIELESPGSKSANRDTIALVFGPSELPTVGIIRFGRRYVSNALSSG
jgi:hypothetical protein